MSTSTSATDGIAGIHGMIRGLTIRHIRGDGEGLIGAGVSAGAGAVFMPAGTTRGMTRGTEGITVAVGAVTITIIIPITETVITVGDRAMGTVG